MSADDLIRAFQEEGAIKEVGEFTLDRDKAREKLAEFQLPDPHRYVLEVVQAATILGATRLDFSMDADELWISFDCERAAHRGRKI